MHGGLSLAVSWEVADREDSRYSGRVVLCPVAIRL